MNLKLEIPNTLATALKLNAETRGLDLATYVVETLRALTPEASVNVAMSHEQFRAKLQDLIDSHPKDLPFVDDSRDSIYDGRGE